MGSRAGYRVRGRPFGRRGQWISPILRKQDYVGGGKEEIEDLLLSIGRILGTPQFESQKRNPTVGNGKSALRDDLGPERLAAALYHVLYKPPFDSIEPGSQCDISQHGIYELEVASWHYWRLWHYDVVANGVPVNQILLAEVNLSQGKRMDNGGMTITFPESFKET